MVATQCPRCGAEHVLDLRRTSTQGIAAPAEKS
jgi:hypothetical protein